MTRAGGVLTLRTVGVLAAALLITALIVGVRGCRDRDKVEKRAVAKEKVAEWQPVLDSLRRELAVRDRAVERKDSALSAVLARPPVVVTRTITVSGEAWVPRLDFDALAGRLDSLRVVTLAFRDTVRVLRATIPPTLAAVDTVIKYQRVLIETPKPRRRWGLGVYGGYGATTAGAEVRLGPQVGVGLSYSF